MKYNKLLTIFLISVFLISFTSAYTSKDFVRDNDRATELTKYGTITLKEKWFVDVFGWFEKDVKQITLTENTESCGSNCHFITDINLLEDGVLIEDDRFYRIMDDGSWVLSNIRSMQYLIKTGEEEYTKDVYEWKCEDTGIISKNGTKEESCDNVLTGKEILKRDLWETYELGTELPKGEYKIKGIGTKRADWTYDWQIKSNGVWITEWAVWGFGSPITEGHGVTATNAIGHSGGGAVAFFHGHDGIVINVTNNMIIYNFSRISSGGNGVACYLINVVGTLGCNAGEENVLRSGTILNNACILNASYFATTGQRLLLTAYMQQSMHTIYNLEGELPKSTTNLQWLQSWNHPAGGTCVVATSATGNLTLSLDNNEITLNSPANNTAFNSSSVTFNATATVVEGATLTNMSLWLNGVLNETQTKTGTTNESIFTKTLNEGSHNWTVQGCDSDGDCGFASENRTVSVDRTPPTIVISNPSGQIASHAFGNNLSINWTITDTNLESCWYDYNGVNTTVTCSDNSTYFVPVTGRQSLKLWANDSLGNKGYNTTSWTYAFLENNASFNSSTQETATESFVFNLTTDIIILSISAFMDYNGTPYTSTSTCNGGNCIIRNTIDISLVNSGTSELHNFFWNFTIHNGTQSINTISSTRTQNVSRIYLEQCNATYTTKSLNFTAYDEQNLSIINNYEFDGTFEFWVGTGSIKRNNSFSKNINEMNLCLSPDVTMKIDGTIDYNEQINNSLYTNRFYYLNDFSINNSLQDIKMYLLKSSAATSFILKVQDESLLPVEDAFIEIHRYYPGEGTFKIVQISKTDDNGKSIGFFQTETVDYKFIIKKNGETLLETGQQKVVPESSPFTLNFNTGDNLGEPWSYHTDISSLNSSLTWDEDTRVATYTYIDTSNNFTSSRLFVQRRSLTNSSAYYTICNETSTLSSATLNCNVGNESGFYIASAYITRSGEGLDKQINFQIETFSGEVGLMGLFLGFFIILISAFLFKFNEVAGMWGMAITIFFVNLMGLVKFGALFVTSIFAMAVILTWVMER